MNRFAALLDALLFTPSRNGKLRLMREYFSTAPDPERGVEGGDAGRLRFLAEVSEAMISTLDTGESADRLARLVVPRLADWAVVSILGEQGRPEEEASAHRDPQGRRDVQSYLGGVLRGSNDEDSPLAVAFMSGAPVHLAPLDPALVEPSLPLSSTFTSCRSSSYQTSCGNVVRIT